MGHVTSSEPRDPPPGPLDAIASGDASDLLTDPKFIVDSVVPPVLFVGVHALAGLRSAAVASLGLAAVLVAWRLVRGQRPLYALSGLFGAVVSVGLALASGRASAYFLPGIVGNAVFAVACVISVLIGRPLIALTSRVLYRWPWSWYTHPRVRPAYAEITLVWAVAYLGRAGGQAWLATRDAVGSLAVVRIATGLPLFVALLGATFVYVNWRLRTLGAPEVATATDAEEPH